MDRPDALTEALLERERALLAALGALLERADAPDDTRRRLADLTRALDELFLVVVAGEFNAGKSTLVNALFGRRVMEEGPVPTTDKITVLRHGDADETHRRSDFVTERRLAHPVPPAARARGHAGHELHRAAAPGADRGLHPARRPRPVRDVVRPPALRVRAPALGLHRRRLGQAARGGAQQGGPVGHRGDAGAGADARPRRDARAHRRRPHPLPRRGRAWPWRPSWPTAPTA